jgi:hypothetical protein
MDENAEDMIQLHFMDSRPTGNDNRKPTTTPWIPARTTQE